jgi:O-succinylbenzoic acid--CoA ligase
MDLSAKRSLTQVGPTWHLPQIMGALELALQGSGDALRFAERENPNLSIISSEIALVVATSGSTGSAKEVCFSANALFASARASAEYLGATSQDRWSLLLPLTHIAGVNVLVRSLIFNQSPIDLRDSFDKDLDGIGFTAIVAAQLHRAIFGKLKDDQKLLRHLQSVKKVLIGGGPLDPALKSKAEAKSISLVETYGSTETSGGCIYDGVPLNGVEVKIVDDQIFLKGDTLASYYARSDSDVPGKIFTDSDGWYQSSDFGFWEENRVKVLGRVDDIIISGGKKISLSLIENIYRETEPEIDFAVFSISDPKWGEKLVIAADKDLSLVKRAEIESKITQLYGGYAVPKEFQKVDRIPRTSLGKLDRSSIIAMREKKENF